MNEIKPGQDVPILRGTITIRSPRSVLLLSPLLPFIVAIFVVSIVFTIWPEALEHSPVSFEERGIIHHLWHYMLMGASALTLLGMFSARDDALRIELSGLVLLIGALAINFTAIAVDFFQHTQDPVTGLGVGFRAAMIFALTLRAWVIIKDPKVALVRTQQGD